MVATIYCPMIQYRILPAKSKGKRSASPCFRVNEDQVPKLVPLCLEIPLVDRIRVNFQGHTLYDIQTVSVEPHNFLGVVGKQSDFPHTKISKDLGADPVVPQIRPKS